MSVGTYYKISKTFSTLSAGIFAGVAFSSCVGVHQSLVDVKQNPNAIIRQFQTWYPPFQKYCGRVNKFRIIFSKRCT